MTEFLPSIMSVLNSIPLFTGPGCIINTSFFAYFNISLLIPNNSRYSDKSGKEVVFCFSYCIRNPITISASFTASFISGVVLTPSKPELPNNVEGPANVTLTPNLDSPNTLLLATRL